MKSNVPENHDRLYLKACFIGSNSVGKTSFLIRFLQGSFPGEYFRAVYPITRYDTTYGNDDVTIELVDVRSKLESPELKPLIFQDINVVVIFYSVTDRSSFAEVERVWAREAITYCPGVPVVLVASKTDLRDIEGDLVSTDKVASKTDLSDKDQDVVNAEEGKEMARRVCAESFVEISSLKGEGLDDLMSEVVRCAVDHKTRMSLSKKVEKRRNVCCII